MNEKVVVAKWGERTLIAASRTLAESKTLLAGLILECCFAISRALMDAGSEDEERAPLRSSVGCGEIVDIVGTRGGCEDMCGTRVHESCGEEIRRRVGMGGHLFVTMRLVKA